MQVNLDNIECEYKFAVNTKYIEQFKVALCQSIAKLVHIDSNDLLVSFKSVELSNEYFDTQNDDLFKTFKAGLRLRKSSQDSKIEQTLKFKLNDIDPTHIEINAYTVENITTPQAHLFTEHNLVPKNLLLLLDKVQAKYQTNFKREYALFCIPNFLSFEVAIDIGEIRVNNYDKTLPISEVEFELKDIDQDYIKAEWGKSIFDLEDIKLKFCALLNDLILPHLSSYYHMAQKFNCEQCKVQDDCDYSCKEQAHQQYDSIFTEGLLSFEPFSKLKRAVILKKISEDNQLPYVDLDKLQIRLNEYQQKAEVSLQDFSDAIFYIINCFFKVIAYAHMFDTQEHKADVIRFIELIDQYIKHHTRLKSSEEIKCAHQYLREQSKLSDLSMLIVLECTLLFIEYNHNLWIMPLYHKLKAKHHDKFSLICAQCLAQAFTLKSAEYIEQLQYILKRQKIILSALNNESLALVTQSNLKQIWANLNLYMQVKNLV